MIPKEVRNYIRDADWTDMGALVQLVKSRRNELMEEIGQTFSVGEQVSFRSKRGFLVKGTIQKINRKHVKMKAEDGGMWSVSPSLLRRNN